MCARLFISEAQAKQTGNNAPLASSTSAPKKVSTAMTDGSSPRFLQGAFEFKGDGYEKPVLLDDSLRYVVPAGATTQPVYFRGGNSSKQMISVVLLRDGKPMRYFPIAAKGATHVALRVVEDLLADTVLELCVAAPPGVSGSVIVDLGLVEF
jgi:hypothetical protein